jgi:hypothetical protein
MAVWTFTQSFTGVAPEHWGGTSVALNSWEILNSLPPILEDSLQGVPLAPDTNKNSQPTSAKDRITLMGPGACFMRNRMIGVQVSRWEECS